MDTARVTDIGVVIPQDILAQIGARVGDQMQIIAADGCISLMRCESQVDAQVQIAKRIMEKRRDVLRRFAE